MSSTVTIIAYVIPFSKHILFVMTCLILINIVSNPVIGQDKYEDDRKFHKKDYENQHKISIKIKEYPPFASDYRSLEN